jgi:hypothetical protein
MGVDARTVHIVEQGSGAPGHFFGIKGFGGLFEAPQKGIGFHGLEKFRADFVCENRC